MDKTPVLPDVLCEGLDLVLCGTAPSHASAQQHAYYAHPHNKFWRILFETGLTPRLLVPAEYALLPNFGIGLTDISKFDKGLDRDLARASLGHESTAALRARILQFQPRHLAFTSMTGAARFFGGRRPCGPQPEGDSIGATRVWVLPSTSGLACGSWDSGPWHALAHALKPQQNRARNPVIDGKALSR